MVKPGYKTTEFYVALYAAIIPILAKYIGLQLPDAASIAGFVSTIAYVISRAIVKAKR